MYISPPLKPSLDEEKLWHSSLSEHNFETATSDPLETAIEHLHQVSRVFLNSNKFPDLGTQLGALGSISNWHRWRCLQQNGERYTYVPRVNLYQHLSYNPTHDDDSTDHTKQYPTSLRNQILWFSKCGKPHLVHLVISLAMYSDGRPSTEPLEHSYSIREEMDNSNIKPSPRSPVKRRQCGPRYRPLTAKMHCAVHKLNYQELSDSASQFRTIFQDYEQAITSEGRKSGDSEDDSMVQNSAIWWRHHTPYRDVFILIDYDDETGAHIPASYVHVTIEDDENGSRSIICSCKTYKYHQTTVGGFLEDMDVLRRITVGKEFTCMHVRFAYNRLFHLSFDRVSILNGPDSTFEHRLSRNLVMDDSPVVMIGEALPHATTKFSVMAQNEFAFVHLFFKETRSFVECQDGHCKARKHRKVLVPGQTKTNPSKDSIDRACVHVKAFLKAIDDGDVKIPKPISREDGMDNSDIEKEETNCHELSFENHDDISLQKIKGDVWFDVATGLWKHSALTDVRPSFNILDDKLRAAVKDRQKWEVPERYIPESHAYKADDLMPVTSDDDDNPLLCKCGVSEHFLLLIFLLSGRGGGHFCNIFRPSHAELITS